MDSKPLYSSFNKNGFIETKTSVKVEGPGKLDLKRMFSLMHAKIEKKATRKRSESLQQSLKLQEELGKIMFRTS
jgi:hypothetical protein